ncbi:MAG: YicC family protein [Bacteroidales bacterium]|nr:YicC family protein [Bacteroidales bacterium]
MAKSMTGYGKAEAILEGGKLTIEFRSLNGKNADISIKSQLLPKDREIAVRRKIAETLQRGTIDMYLNWEPNAADSAKQINSELVQSYYRQIKEIKKTLSYSNPGEIATGKDDAIELMSIILKLPDVVDSRKQDIVTEANWPMVEKAVDDALADIDDFRAREGAILAADVSSKVEKILECSREIEKYEQERSEAVRTRIMEKFEELQLKPDHDRLEQEMIFYLEKLDINEERVRLRQHCAYYLETLREDPLPGKKLGFIAQEMGREINTTGSKANHTEIQKLVTLMKDELEKIKEQSLNIL